MNNKGFSNTIILLIVGGLIIFAVGIGLGIFYQSQSQSKNPAIQQAIKIQPTINILASKTVQSIVVTGRVVKIVGRNMTLTYAGDQITTGIGANAQIFSSALTKDPVTKNLISGVPQPVDFSTIAAGDNVTATLKMLPTGQLEGESVYIFPGT